MAKLITIIVLLFNFLGLMAQDNNVSYNIKANLDPKTKIINGQETIYFTNKSKDVIKTLQFHLYLNAFKDDYSTFMKESNGGRLRTDELDKNEKINFGYVYITKLSDAEGKSLYSKMRFIQPDDLNINDKTVVEVLLDKPILPNQTVSYTLNFRSKLPKIFARTGFTKSNFFLIGQWFPKLGVYEYNSETNKGSWNCHQFHANTEFYSDFGDYAVDFTLPKDYKIGATGQLLKKFPNSNATITYNFLAKNVHDFALTAQPDFVEFHQSWKGIKLSLLLQPHHLAYKERYFQSVIHALEYLDKHVGKYPHRTLTLVDPPLDGSGAMGMEYPTFITGGYAFWGMPSSVKLAEVVTIHEFGHQYFQGLLASNEFEESFLDEGFNQYFEGRILNTYYKNGSIFNTAGFRVNDVASSRFSYVSMQNPKITEIKRNAWQYPNGAYGIMSYSKTAIALQTLHNLLGEKTMDVIFKTYFERWKFKHPKFSDFVAIVNEIAPKATKYKYGTDFNWFFEQAFYKAPDSEYEVLSLKNSGRKENPSSLVHISRKGEFIMPQEIKFVFDDNKTETIFWSGNERDKSFQFSKRLKSVVIDPDNKNLLELNRINNSKTAKMNTLPFWKYALKSKFWIEVFWESLASLA